MLYKKINWTIHSIYNGDHLTTNGDDPISLLMLGIYSIKYVVQKNIEITIFDFQYYFVTKIVLTYCEKKNVLVIEKNFWNSRLKAENLQNFWYHLNNLFKQ